MFYDAESALRQVKFRCPHLVVSDVVMPRMNGVELAILIKQRYPECKVLLFSVQPATVNILAMAGRRRYSFECLAKPVHPLDLLVTVETLDHNFEEAPVPIHRSHFPKSKFPGFSFPPKTRQ